VKYKAGLWAASWIQRGAAGFSTPFPICGTRLGTIYEISGFDDQFEVLDRWTTAIAQVARGPLTELHERSDAVLWQ
jgi:hypothetical protein